MAVSQKLVHPVLVNKLYALSENQLKWFAPGRQADTLRRALIGKMDSARLTAPQKIKYHYAQLKKNERNVFAADDSVKVMRLDKIFSDAAMSFCKDIYQGADIAGWISYDGLTAKHKDTDEAYLLNTLSAVKSPAELAGFFSSLEPRTTSYVAVRNKMNGMRDSLPAFQKHRFTSSLNFSRWVSHFNFEKYILVNIPSATLWCYSNDTVTTKMKVVLGKPDSKTPCFAAYCNQLILYPYWNVPTGIAVNELLPKFKRDSSQVDELNMQVIDAAGNVVDHHKLKWKNYSKAYFPYRLRQSTGCDNSLGVIKFNVTSPLGVYLHDTNFKAAFLSGQRYYSHGCIRVEDPIALAEFLLPRAINKEFLDSCLKDQLPITLDLAEPVPVFVVYQTVEADANGSILYFKDVYHFLQ